MTKKRYPCTEWLREIDCSRPPPYVHPKLGRGAESSAAKQSPGRSHYAVADRVDLSNASAPIERSSAPTVKIQTSYAPKSVANVNHVRIAMSMVQIAQIHPLDIPSLLSPRRYEY